MLFLLLLLLITIIYKSVKLYKKKHLPFLLVRFYDPRKVFTYVRGKTMSIPIIDLLYWKGEHSGMRRRDEKGMSNGWISKQPEPLSCDMGEQDTTLKMRELGSHLFQRALLWPGPGGAGREM